MDRLDLELLAPDHTVNEIASIKQCSVRAVRSALKNASLKAKDRNEDFHRKIEELYEKEMSSYEIADLLHRPRPTISKHLHDAHLSRSRQKSIKLAFSRNRLRNSFVCNICHRRKNLSKLTKSTRFSGKFGCRECIEKNDCILGTIIPPAQPGEKVPHELPPPRVYRIVPSRS